ncbi:EVE domain-containing protein [Salmonirosea aquatica]|uniref:UPF0310 protein GBK04_19690 n=1 Tax=Salmonirosea aquatica TaxID=2654236 RepID=A0A7C9FEE5_9BACT|nr:EVE domain-containing protein [Cytophagaceae bacterium SJW1-29]
MTRYFLIAASRDHVLGGVKNGFAQAGHGRRDYISKPAKGDWVVYYSAKEKIDETTPCQKFTAFGQVTDDEPYQPDPNSDFKPYRRDVEYQPGQEAEIRPLLEKLSFIKNKKQWGFYLMGGFREIPKEDFEVIIDAMTN